MPDSATIVSENLKEGTPQSVWHLSGPGSESIEGFTTDISYDLDELVEFKINTDSSDYRIDIYRLGYYGGDGARLVGSINHDAESFAQPDPLTDSLTGLVDAGNWHVTDTWEVPPDAVSGVYVAKLVREDGTFGENHIHFVVRDDGSESDILFQTSDTTWQAYNSWGGSSLYNLPNGTSAAYAVSYNRPLVTNYTSFGVQENSLFGAEYAAIRWLEENGYGVSYTSSVDTARYGDLLLNHNVFLSVGHDEYWSAEQRANVEAARDAGVHLQFWGGNDVYWKTQWAPDLTSTETPFRTLITYKETQTGVQNPSGVWTGTWGDPRATEDIEPQSSLIGTTFTVNGNFSNLQVPYDFSQLRFWRNTDVADIEPGQAASFQNLLGVEWDEDLDNGFRPDGLIHLSTTTADVFGPLVLDPATGVFAPGTATHNLVLYKAPSGALVFGAGTQFWTWALDSNHYPSYWGDVIPVDQDIQQAMVNLFADMGVQPATLQPWLVAASPSTDFVAPTTMLSEFNLVALGENVNVSLSGAALDVHGRVAGVEVSLDGGDRWSPAAGQTSWTFGFEGETPATMWVRAMDDSVNIGPASVVPQGVIARAVYDSSIEGGSVSSQCYLNEIDGSHFVVWDNYGVSGQWNQQTIVFSDGTLGVGIRDPLNTEQWELTWNSYDSAGNWYQQECQKDDGGAAIWFNDVGDDQLWQTTWDHYDSVGQWYQQDVQNDDGGTAKWLNDVKGEHQWQSFWNYYDSSGRWIGQDGVNDDGTNWTWRGDLFT